MKTSTITDFRQNMKERLEEIQDNQDILILTGPKKKDFVVLTLEAFNAMEETSHLLSTSANSKRLLESIALDKAGKTVVRNVDPPHNKTSGSPANKKKSSRRSK